MDTMTAYKVKLQTHKIEDFPLLGPKKVVVLLSGGMDSTTLAYYMKNLGREVYPITFFYGQKHQKELEMAYKTCEKLGLTYKLKDIDIDELAPSALTRKDIEVPEGHYEAESMKLTVVPNRNMVFLSLATAYAIGIGATEVAYAAHSGDHAIYADCRPVFVEAMREAILLCDDVGIYFRTPFIYLDKKDILEIGQTLGVDYSLTWSCYRGGELACGLCGTCVERLEAFSKLGIEDPIKYKEGNDGA